jgi:hypothetical protein
MDLRTLNAEAPMTPAWSELALLIERRDVLAARIDDLRRQHRGAHEAATKAAAAVADAERAALAGEGAQDTKKLDAALGKARARAAEPWDERVAGAQTALADFDRNIGTFVRENYGDLQSGLRAEGEDAAQAVDQAATDLVAAFRRREDVLGRMIALASVVGGSPRPSDWTYSRAERLAGEADRLLTAGGETVPVVRDPRQPRHGAAA